jgi:hypothetical protein
MTNMIPPIAMGSAFPPVVGVGCCSGVAVDNTDVTVDITSVAVEVNWVAVAIWIWVGVCVSVAVGRAVRGRPGVSVLVGGTEVGGTTTGVLGMRVLIRRVGTATGVLEVSLMEIRDYHAKS